VRVDFNITSTSVPDARLEFNIAHARSLGLPAAVDRVGGGAVNIIGRGPSVARHVDELRGCPDNWAAGSAWAWCRDNGIDAVMIMADPHPRLAGPQYVSGVKCAIVASQCDPSLFAALEDVDVRLADTEVSNRGWTAAVMGAVLAANPDSEVRLYGCEGSYETTTHADEDIPQPNEMLVRANGRVFRTNPQMIMQSEEFALLFRICKPGTFVDCSGGLLGALIASGGEWELIEWANAPANVRALMERGNTGNPGWGDDGVADAAALQPRAAQ
jgi:hypothetical protein